MNEFTPTGLGNSIRVLDNNSFLSYRHSGPTMFGWADDETALYYNGRCYIIDHDVRNEYDDITTGAAAYSKFLDLAEMYGRGKWSEQIVFSIDS